MNVIILKVICFVLLVCPFVSRGRYFRPKECLDNTFGCGDDYNCIEKPAWCDGSMNCNNGIDERYCYNNYDLCDSDLYFQCDTGRCIPLSGRCDGYISCEDRSDEINCPCEKISRNDGIINRKESLRFQTHHICWEIQVKPSKYLTLEIEDITLHQRACSEGNLTIIVKDIPNVEATTTFCSDLHPSTKRIEAFNDVKIIYRSIVQLSYNYYDSFRINYFLKDILCKNPETFKCDQHSCILIEKQCNGIKDCSNGADEADCKKGIAAIKDTDVSLKKGLGWLLQQRNAAWGWRDNTHRAVTALYLSNGANFNGTNKDEDLIAKQLELQMSTAILRNGTDKISPTQLAMFVNALLVICHNPRNFYGFNLVRDLKDLIDKSTGFIHPLPYLALCNAKEKFATENAHKLLEILKQPSNHGILLDIQAEAVLALSCIANDSAFAFLKPNITQAAKLLKQQQMNDGSFGSEYTSAVIVQALLANGHELDEDWNLSSAINFLMKKQNPVDGSFGGFLATYFILPLLNAKSLVDIGRVNCSENMKRPRDGNPVSDIEYKLGPKISIQYSLYIGDEKDQIHPITLRTAENVTILEVMRLAADADPKYNFQSHIIKGKTFIYELSGIPNDPEDGKFWILYTRTANSTEVLMTKSPEEVIVNDKENIIMWYKTTDIQDFKETPTK